MEAKEIIILLKEQHKNTRHDAVDVIQEIQARYVEQGYSFPERLFNEMVGKIMNLKERFPNLGNVDGNKEKEDYKPGY